MRPIIIFAAPALLALAFLACGDDEEAPAPTTPPSEPSPTPSERSLEFETLVRGANSGVMLESAEARKITSAEEWAALWSQHQAIVTPAASPPAVDFTDRMVVAVFDRVQPTGGYSIEVREIVAADGRLEVAAERTSPGRGCVTTQALTQPFHIVVVETAPGEPELALTETVIDCD